MDDKQIVDLYWERSETAISETSKKYGKYCRYIAFNILRNDEDSEEWNALCNRTRCNTARLGVPDHAGHASA